MTAAAPSNKTARTRARLLGAAFELCARQGYEQATVAQIASTAGVAEMTFYRHFGSKVQLLIDDSYDPLITKAIGEQPIELPPLTRAVHGIRLAWRRLPITEDSPVWPVVISDQSRPPIESVAQVSASEWTTATEHSAWAISAWLVEPSSRPAKPPRPRLPTTSNWVGGPVVPQA